MKKETSKLIKEYITYKTLQGLKEKQLKRKESRLFALFSYTKKSPLQTEEGEINNYLEIRSKVIAVKTYNDYITLIKDFYNYLLREKIILINPSKRLERKKRKTANHLGVFTEEEIKQILFAIPDNYLGIRDKAIIEVMYSTGIRVKELIMLNISDVEYRTGELYILNGKGNKERVVPIGRRALDALEKYLTVRAYFMNSFTDKEALFLSMEKNRLADEQIRRIVYKYKENAGIKTKGGPHALRHSCATHMLKRGAKIKDVARLLGHTTISSTQYYTHLSKDDLQKVYLKTHPNN